MVQVALITGVSGQDGSYLAELLMSKGLKVYGMIRHSSTSNIERVFHLLGNENFELVTGDMTDSSSLDSLIRVLQPDYVFNLAAQSFVQVSFTQPVLTSDVTGKGVLLLLEAIKKYGKKECRFYQAASSEQFGLVREIPQTELTPFYPRSPYGVAKTYAYWMTVNYRESYNMFCCNGILFNHESPRRGQEFVTRKITSTVAAIKCGLQDKLVLGNLDALRDWGHARDYVEAMWLMLQQEKPDDYVIATGIMHSVRDVVKMAFATLEIDDWEKYVETNAVNLRPAEVFTLCGDASKAHDVLGWEPKTSFEELIREMTLADYEIMKGIEDRK